jgi:hypothetical protein
MRLRLTAALVLTPLLSACTDLSFRQLQLGQTPQQYDRVLPAENTRRTDRGLCHLTTSRLGRTDAVVVVLTGDRRIAAKLHATRTERDYGWRKESGYRLEAELDLKLANLGAVGPFDAIRALLADLEPGPAEQFVKDAHGWVLAGLHRLRQRWPHLADEPAPSPELAATLDRVPAGGAAILAIDERGVLRLRYEHGKVR